MFTVTALSNECGEPDLLLSPSSTLCSASPIFISPDMMALPRLEISSFDTSPFSNSFSGLIKEELINWQRDTKVANDADTSYDIKRFTDMKELVPEWDDEDVDEILVMCPKTNRQLSPIEEESSRPISLADFEAVLDYSIEAPLYRKHDTGRLYIVKSFSNLSSRQASERIVLEILMDVKASFLPRLHWSFHDDNIFCIVMEYYSRKTLQDLVTSEGALSQQQARFYSCEIVQALTALHAFGIVHRDLQPDHIVIDTAGHVVVEGFVSSEALLPCNKGRDCGSIFCRTPVDKLSVFSAPELLLGWSHDFIVDTWGFGVLLLYMITGKYILGGCDVSPIGWREMIVYSPIILPLFLDSVTHDLISKCLERNPMARLSLSLVKKHEYFTMVDWKKVAAKRIRAPCPLKVSVDENHNQFRSRIDKAVYSVPKPRTGHTRTMSRVRSFDDSSKTVLETAPTPAANYECLDVLPNIRRMSSLLDNLPETMEPTISTPPSEPPVYSALTLNDTSPNPLKLNLNTGDRMALFWESLDAGAAPMLPNSADQILRPRKLRKSRSSIYPEHRVSTLSTVSLQNLTKLCKLGRSTSALPRPEHIPNLPDGVKQIGGGIGFKYNVPAAARSKASICTNTPQACHGFFRGRLLRGLGMRSPTAIAKAKARRTLMSLVVTERQEDRHPFPSDFRGSNWSLVVPTSPDDLGEEAGGTGTTKSSPTTEAGPLTPATLACEDADIAVAGDEGFEESMTPESGADDSEQMTLRLVTKSVVY